MNIPEKDNWVNLKRLLKYIKGTRNIKLTLKVDSMSMVIWWVDESYNTQGYCKGQNRSMMSIGKEAAVIPPRNKKLNVRSSTES